MNRLRGLGLEFALRPLEMNLQLHIVGTIKIEISYCDNMLISLMIEDQNQDYRWVADTQLR